MCEILSNFPDTQMQQSTVTVPNSAENHWLSLLTHHAMVSMCVVQSVQWISSWISRVPIAKRRAICCHAQNDSGSTYIMVSSLDLGRSWPLTTISFKSIQCLILDTHTALCIQTMLLELTQKHIIMFIKSQLYTNVYNIAWLLEKG
jgi:hypothetical protein